MDPLIVLMVLRRGRELRAADRRPPEETLRRREEALWKLRKFTYAASPFYREFHRGLYDAPLSQLPILTKPIMMEHFNDLVTDPRLSISLVERHLESLDDDKRLLDNYRVASTSGSSGRRGFFVFDPDEWGTAIASFRRTASWCGVSMPFWGGHSAGVASSVPWHMSARAGATLRPPWGSFLQLDVAEPLEEMVGRLNRFRPRFMTLYPSVGRLLAEEQLAGRLKISPRAIFTGSEVLTSGTRSRMEEAWGKQVYDHYGATETGSIAAECSRHRLHAAEDLLVIEAVDHDGRPVPPGVPSDRLLVTVLFRHTQPLIRYEISDRVVFSSDSCGCGLPWRVIERVEGRDEDVLRLPAAEGTEVPVHPVVFERVLDNLPTGGWQVTAGDDGLTVLLTDVEGELDDKTIADEVRRGVERAGAAPLPVTVRRVSALARGATGKAPHVRRRTSATGKLAT